MSPPEVQLPNGMAWREGSALVYFVDSGEESITEYATDDQVLWLLRYPCCQQIQPMISCRRCVDSGGAEHHRACQ